MKHFSLFVFLLLVIGFTSCEKSDIKVYDLDGQYEATILKTTTVANQDGVISVDESGETFQLTIDNDRFFHADKGNEVNICEGTVIQKEQAVRLTSEVCNTNSFAGLFQYDQEAKTLTRTSATTNTEGDDDCTGNCGGSDGNRADYISTTVRTTYTLRGL